MCDPFGEATSIAFVGEIRVFSFGYVPKGWAASAGQVLPIQENTELFGLIGDTYGGDGQTTFRLPDLRGRVSGMSSTSAISAPVIRSRRRGDCLHAVVACPVRISAGAQPHTSRPPAPGNPATNATTASLPPASRRTQALRTRDPTSPPRRRSHAHQRPPRPSPRHVGTPMIAVPAEAHSSTVNVRISCAGADTGTRTGQARRNDRWAMRSRDVPPPALGR